MRDVLGAGEPFESTDFGIMQANEEVTDYSQIPTTDRMLISEANRDTAKLSS